MLEFFIANNAFEHPWREDNLLWRSGDSFIQPFAHNALESFAFGNDVSLTVIVRERLNGYSGPKHTSLPKVEQPDSSLAKTVLQDMEEWPLHFMIIKLELDQNLTEVSVQNGTWATAPVFLTSNSLGFYGHWDPIALYPHLPNLRVDNVRLTHFLTAFETPYSGQNHFLRIADADRTSCGNVE